jgi:hypothetical protein
VATKRVKKRTSRRSRSGAGPARRHAWRVGEFFHRPGGFTGDLGVWRVIETFGRDSPYVLGLDITTTRSRPAGSVKRMIDKKTILPVRDPMKHLAANMLTGEPNVSAAHASWG